jgi:hypothetical protein
MAGVTGRVPNSEPLILILAWGMLLYRSLIGEVMVEDEPCGTVKRFYVKN